MWLALDPTVFFLYQPVPQIIKPISWIWKYFPASSKYHYFGQCCIEVNWCEGMAWPINPDLSILICRSWPVNTCTLWDLFSLRIRPSFDLSGAVVMRSAGGWGTACPEELLSHTCLAYSPLPAARWLIEEEGVTFTSSLSTQPDMLEQRKATRKPGWRRESDLSAVAQGSNSEMFLSLKSDVFYWLKENHLLNICLSPPTAALYRGTDFPWLRNHVSFF